jgi:hypothetical protein
MSAGASECAPGRLTQRSQHLRDIVRSQQTPGVAPRYLGQGRRTGNRRDAERGDDHESDFELVGEPDGDEEDDDADGARGHLHEDGLRRAISVIQA